MPDWGWNTTPPGGGGSVKRTRTKLCDDCGARPATHLVELVSGVLFLCGKCV